MLDRKCILPLAIIATLVFTSVQFAQTGRLGGANKGGPSDIELVEKLLIARRDYQRTLELLRAFYLKNGDPEREKWAKDELIEYHRINHQAYRLDLDVPPPTLQAASNIPEANKLIADAKGKYKDKGFGNDYIDNQRRAELLLQHLLTQYPTSNKIGEAAYLLGDIYESSACKQYRRAAVYFERCFQWNPAAPMDARIRAARLYDKKLNDHSHAGELYQEITTHETDPKQIEEAQKRLNQLRGNK
jgi:hypothetical protein